MSSGIRHGESPQREPPLREGDERDWTLRLIEQFDKSVLRPSVSDSHEFFARLAKELKDTFDARLVRIWDYNRYGRYLVLQQSYPQYELSGSSFTIDVKQSFTGLAIEKSSMVAFSDLRQPVGNRRFQNPSVLEELGLNHLICIPVFGPSDTGVPMFVMDLFFSGEPPAAFEQHQRAIDWLTSALGRALDYLRYGMGEMVRRSVGKSTLVAAGVSGLFDGVFAEIQRFTHCSRASLLRVDNRSHKLVVERSDGVSKLHPGHFYRASFDPPPWNDQGLAEYLRHSGPTGLHRSVAWIRSN